MEKESKLIQAANLALKTNFATPNTIRGVPSPAGGSNEKDTLSIHTIKYPNSQNEDGYSFLEKVNNRANITGKLIASMWQAGNYAHLEEPIKRTSRCVSSRIVENEQTVKTWMCGKRWCSNCINVQASILMKRFLPIYEELNDLYFVTLTISNPPEDGLTDAIKTMNKVFSSIHRNMKEYQKMEFNAIRKIEYTHGTIQGRIHPHFHIIIQGQKQAQELRAQWITKMNKEGIYVSALGQDIKECDDNALFEILKYVHKSLKEETKETTGGKRIKTGTYYVDGWKENEAWKQITTMRFRLLSTYGKFYAIKTDLTEEEIKQEIKSNALVGVPDGTYVRERGRLVHIQTGEVIVKPNYKQKVYDTRTQREITFQDVEYVQRIPLREEENDKPTPRFIIITNPNDGAPHPE